MNIHEVEKLIGTENMPVFKRWADAQTYYLVDNEKHYYPEMVQRFNTMLKTGFNQGYNGE